MTPLIDAKRRRGVRLFIFITIFLDMVGIGLIIPVLPALLTDVGQVDLGRAAQISGAMFATYSVAQFIMGPVLGNLSDAFGRRPLLLLAIGGMAADYVLCALAPSLSVLFLGRLIAGICGASYVIANAVLADITPPEDRAAAFGMVGAAFGLGFVIGPGVGGLLGEFGPRVPFWTAAGVSAVNFCIGYFALPESLSADNRRKFDWRRANPFGAFKVFRTYPTVLPLSIVTALFFFGSAVYPTIWPFWGMARFGWSEAGVGITLMGFGIVQSIMQGGLSGPLVRRFGERRVALMGLISATIAAVGYGFADSLLVVLVLLIIHGPEGLIHPMLMGLASREVPENAQGELQGGMSAIMNLVMLFGTIFYSQTFGFFMSDRAPVQSPSASFFIAAGILAVTLVTFVRMQKAHRAKAD